MTNSVNSIISLKKHPAEIVSIYIFKYPVKKFRRQKVTIFLASDENFYRQIFLRTMF